MTVATDTWLVSPYTDEGYLSYVANADGTGVQQHPGNGVGFEEAGGVRTVTICYSLQCGTYPSWLLCGHAC